MTASTTYRLRGLPAHVKHAAVASFLVNAVDGLGPTENILACSVAASLSPWETAPTKTVTLMFTKTPDRFADGRTEWAVSIEGHDQSLIFDKHFLGFTALSDPARGDHQFDCIAISGLASHPFGSWKQRGSNFMWLRDSLPRHVPMIRPIIYGYDTELIHSHSFQSIDDLARSFVTTLDSLDRRSQTAKPLIIMAHSLGGIVLKRAMVMLSSRADADVFTVNAIRAILLFGVPNRGMHMSHLLPMVKGQPNEVLVQDLSLDSQYLSLVNEQFNGTAILREIHLITAYETKKSQTTKMSDVGKWERTGPYEILVDRDSAIPADINLQYSFPINEDHSAMVKFSEGSEYLRHIVKCLHDLVTSNLRAAPSSTDKITPNEEIIKLPDHDAATNHVYSVGANGSLQEPTDKLVNMKSKSRIEKEILAEEILRDPAKEQQRQIKELCHSLHFEESTWRHENIVEAHQTTLDWVIEDTGLGFISWLQGGIDDGAFWIRGKPGSGKSTLMKFLHDDPGVTDIIHTCRPYQTLTTVWFFFNERGSQIEKSFEGLLRTIVCQLVESHQWLAELVLPVYLERVSRKEGNRGIWHIQDLREALYTILGQDEREIDVLMFLDALDEYSGPPEIIADFIRSITIPPAHTKTKTTIRICFSSRPWDAFVKIFDTYPGFNLHEQTKEAIRLFVTDQLRGIESVSQSLSLSGASLSSTDIIFRIVDRAEGVFLWVKLVVEALLSAGSHTSLGQLEKMLDALPDGLEELYQRTIDRIPRSSRIEAWRIIEILNRANRTLSLRDLLGAAKCAGYSTFKDCARQTRQFYEDSVFMHDRLHLKNLCGGLVEIMGDADYSSSVQFMHQTVKEFVSVPDFGRRMLGEHHETLGENGFLFLVKYGFAVLDLETSLISRSRKALQGTSGILIQVMTSVASGRRKKRAARNDRRDPTKDFRLLMTDARVAEETTGKPHTQFLESVGDEWFERRGKNFLPSYSWDRRHIIDSRSWKVKTRLNYVPSIMAFAVAASLLLYMKEKLHHGVSINTQPTSRIPLLHNAIYSLQTGHSFTKNLLQSQISMVQCLLDHGADLTVKFEGATAFQRLLPEIAFIFIVADERLTTDWVSHYFKCLLRVTEMFLNSGQDANVPVINLPSGFSISQNTKPFHVVEHIRGRLMLRHSRDQGESWSDDADEEFFQLLDSVCRRLREAIPEAERKPRGSTYWALRTRFNKLKSVKHSAGLVGRTHRIY